MSAAAAAAGQTWAAAAAAAATVKMGHIAIRLLLGHTLLRLVPEVREAQGAVKARERAEVIPFSTLLPLWAAAAAAFTQIWLDLLGAPVAVLEEEEVELGDLVPLGKVMPAGTAMEHCIPELAVVPAVLELMLSLAAVKRGEVPAEPHLLQVFLYVELAADGEQMTQAALDNVAVRGVMAAREIMAQLTPAAAAAAATVPSPEEAAAAPASSSSAIPSGSRRRRLKRRIRPSSPPAGR